MKTFTFFTKLLLALMLFSIGIQLNYIYSQNFQDTLDYPWQFNGFSYSIPDSMFQFPVNNMSDRESLIQTIWVPESPGGIIPYDLVYIGDEINKLFVYGDRKIIIIDGTSHVILQELYLSDYGSESLGKHNDIFDTKEKHLAWNPDIRMIYCVSDNKQLFLINPQTSDIIQLPDQSVGMYAFDYTIIKYNPLTHQLFWLIANKTQNFSKLLVFATSGQSITKQYELYFNQPFDLEFHPSNPYFYITDNQRLEIYDCFTHEESNSYDMGMKAGEIIIAYSTEYEIDKIFCLPNSLNINANVDPFALVLNGNSTDEIPLDHYYYTSGIYNPEVNLVFFGYSYDNPNGAGVSIYNVQNSILMDHPFTGLLAPYDYVSDFICSGDKTIGATENQIIFFNNQYFLTDYTYDEKWSSHFFRLCSGNSSHIFVTNVHAAAIDIFSCETYGLLRETTTGNPSYHGFYNNNSKKLYTWNFHDKGNSQITIYNKTNNTIKTVDIGYWPSGISWNPQMNKIYVTNYNDSNIRIKILDCTSDQLDNLGFTIDGRTRCTGIFWAPGNKLYISAEIGFLHHNPIILIYDLNLHEVVKSIWPYAALSPNGHDSHFLYEPSSNQVFVSLKEWATDHGSIISIINDPTQNYDYHIYLLPNVDKLEYNRQDNSLIIRQYNHNLTLIFNSIYILNLNDGSYISVPVKNDVSTADIEYDPSRNNIYCTFNDISGDIYKLEGSTGDFLRGIRASGIVNSLQYNPANRNMYVHMVFNYAIDRMRNEELLSLNPDKDELTYIGLDQKESPRSNVNAYITDIILDEQNNQIYLTNAQSNIKVIQCSAETLTFQPRSWTWTSFPRLQRIGNETFQTTDLLDNIIQFPIPMELDYLYPGNPDPFIETYNPDLGQWFGNLPEVSSSLGYKFNNQSAAIAELPLKGTILAPETTFLLYSMKSNWTGYFLGETQSPFDAIGTEFLDKITWIAGQYWYCHKESNHTKNSGYWWRCACEQGRIELKYADMIEIFPSEDIPEFHWQYRGLPSLQDPKNPSQLFQYNEQPEYNAMFIELDTMSRPVEIGAFAGDSCIGATTVLPTDTTVLICGYTQGYEGQEITFDLVYPARSSGPEYDDYYVLNNQTGIPEQRRIIVGEKQPYFLVSFKHGTQSSAPVESSWLQCRPNPADNEVTVSYFINHETAPNIKLMNNLGILVKSWEYDKQNAGSYSYKFSTSGLPAGCYQILMDTGNSIINQKLLIIH